MIVIVDHDEIAQLQVTCSAGSFASNALHGATIAKETICVIGCKVEAGLVEDSSRMGLCDCQTDSIGKSLTQRASRDFDTIRILSLGMARRDTVDLLR